MEYAVYSTTQLLLSMTPTIENGISDQYRTVLFLPSDDNRQGEGGLRTQGYFKKSYDAKPLISIITVVFNGEKYLEETILSVLNQDYDNVEYIIIDGGSTDETINIIRKYEHVIDYWVSEPDKGIYDAMNKGVCLSQGELIALINADDFYEKNIFNTIIASFLSRKCDVIYGDFYKLTDTNRILQYAHSTGRKYNIRPLSYRWIWLGMIFGHPTVFITKNTYKKIGLYNIKYKISGDYDLILRILRKKLKLLYIKKPIMNFRIGGVSTRELVLRDKEDFEIRKKHNFFLAYIVHVLLEIKNKIKNIKRTANDS